MKRYSDTVVREYFPLLVFTENQLWIGMAYGAHIPIYCRINCNFGKTLTFLVTKEPFLPLYKD